MLRNNSYVTVLMELHFKIIILIRLKGIFVSVIFTRI